MSVMKKRRTYSDAKLLTKIEQRYVCEPNSGCWLWNGRVNIGGYGLVYAGRRSQLIASRAVYELTIGPIGEGLCVCHRCDTPACVNPAHLFVGTKAANSDDKVRKGRQHRWHGRKRGEDNEAAKLSEPQVKEIMRLKGVQSQRQLARTFGVTRVCISAIHNGKAWGHLFDENGLPRQCVKAEQAA